MRKKTRKMRKKIGWIVNLSNVIISGVLVAKGMNPMFCAMTCTVALATTLIAVIPEMLKGELTITDTML
jgi:hypothetical protein